MFFSFGYSASKSSIELILKTRQAQLVIYKQPHMFYNGIFIIPVYTTNIIKSQYIATALTLGE